MVKHLSLSIYEIVPLSFFECMMIFFPIQAANEHLKQVVSNASEEAFSDSQSDSPQTETMLDCKVYSFVFDVGRPL